MKQTEAAAPAPANGSRMNGAGGREVTQPGAEIQGGPLLKTGSGTSQFLI